ncbi:MAG: DUF4112 domain-containing protein [Pyrinomonadaceae bacterium]|nr:DUF4112 domain-containing protein [Pyrinomonadaceae bacterium]
MSKNSIVVPIAASASMGEKVEENPLPAKAVKLERELDQLTRWTDNLIRVPVVGWRIGLDPILGFFFPVVGDLFDAWWKSNQRNTDLLRRRATVSAEEAKRGRMSDWLFVGLIMVVLLGLLLGSIAVTIYFWGLLIRNTFGSATQ